VSTGTVMCVSIRMMQVEAAVRHSIGTSLAVGFVLSLVVYQPAEAHSLGRVVRGDAGILS
jgi:hypothetical protein